MNFRRTELDSQIKCRICQVNSFWNGKIVFKNVSHQWAGKVSSCWISGQVNIYWIYVHVTFNLLYNKLVNSETVIWSCWERICWWFSVINRKDWNFKLICPSACHGLHHSTGKSNKASTVHMNHNCINLLIVIKIILITTTEKYWFFNRFCFKMKLLMIENSNLNFSFSISQNIREFIISTLQRNVNFFIYCNVFKGHFY